MRTLPFVLTFLSLSLGIFSCSDDDNPNPKTMEEADIFLPTEVANISGTLTTPAGVTSNLPVVLIIAGSGPTDRDGNNTIGLQTDSYKLIAESLAENGIASIRYDKRGIAASFYEGFKEEDLLFEHYVDDAKAWVELIKNDGRFSKVYVLGHSEGALIGSIVAAEMDIDGFISVAGAAKKASDILREQLVAQPEPFKTQMFEILEELEQGNTVSNVNELFYSLFRPSVQPYLISWFQYDPKEEISKISESVLIVHGITDIQVKFTDAQSLAESQPNAELVIIQEMNHVLKEVGPNEAENLATYSDPDLPLKEEFKTALISFLQKQ